LSIPGLSKSLPTTKIAVGVGIGYRVCVGKPCIPSRYVLRKRQFPLSPLGSSGAFSGMWGLFRPMVSLACTLCKKRRKARRKKTARKVVRTFSRAAYRLEMSPTGLSLGGLHACEARFRFTRSRGPLPARAEHLVVSTQRTLLAFAGTYTCFNTPSCPAQSGAAGIGLPAAG
jgi:hypothetical protein